MNITHAIALAGAAGAAWLVSAPAEAQTGASQRIECRSSNYIYRRCDIEADREVVGAVLVRRLSGRACTEGGSWGWDDRGVWVDRGCRAEFDVTTRVRYGGAPGGNGYGGPNGAGYGGPNGSYGGATGAPVGVEEVVTCFASGVGRTLCAASGPIATARLEMQRSTVPCTYGSSWGLEGDAVWVANGCGGDFRVNAPDDGAVFPGGDDPYGGYDNGVSDTGVSENGVYGDEGLFGGQDDYGYPSTTRAPGVGASASPYDVSRELWAQRGFSAREVAVAACTRRVMQAAWDDADYAAMYDREPTVRSVGAPGAAFNPSPGGYGDRYWEVSGTIMVHSRDGFEPWTTVCRVDDGVVSEFDARRLP